MNYDETENSVYYSYKPRLFLSYQQGYFAPPEITISQKRYLLANSGLTIQPRVFGSLVPTLTPETPRERNGIVEYEVQAGDTVSSIAQKFNLSITTILWANDLSRRSVLRPGQKLIILPVDGVVHHVRKGDTLSGLAKLYKVKVDDILSYNDIEKDGKIYIGDVLIIPHVKKPVIRFASRVVKPLPDSYFICPITPPCRITQGLHWYNAIDFSHGRCGDPILAAASGVIQKTGYNKIAGNYVRILHPNGVVTFYGHMSKIIVSPGQSVSQGQVIGYMGHTGYTIPRGARGCHLHFEVRGARNPFAR